jgi:hypothetical protein
VQIFISCKVIAIVLQEQQSRNINGGFPESQIGKSSLMCTGVSEKLVQSLKQSARDHYGAMTTWNMTHWKWYRAVQVLVSEEFPVEPDDRLENRA